MPWDEDKQTLMAAGMSESETQNIALELAQKMKAQGASPERFEEAFGKPKTIETGHIAGYFNQQFRRNMPMQDAEKESADPTSWTTAVKAGLQNSVLGLRFRGELPNAQLEEKSLFFEGAPAYQRVIQGATQTIADLPVMGIGALSTPFAPGIGAFAVPQALRAALVKSYDQGGVHSWSDFWDIAKTTAAEGGKGAVIGATTGIAGSVARAATAQASVMAQTLAPMASELTAMTTAGAALEGHMPEPHEFLDNAIIVGGFHAVGSVSSKLKTTFKDTGLHPHEVATQSINDPVLKQEMLGISNETPRSLEPLKQPEINSDFVVVDGKLVKGDDPKAHSEMRLESISASQFIQDNEARFTQGKRLEAAKLHDPAAFRAMEEMSKTVREGNVKLKENEKALEGLRKSESDYAKLNEIRNNLSNPDITKEEFYRLTEQERELEKEEQTLKSDVEKARSLRNENDLTQSQIDRIAANKSIKERLAKAYQAGQKTLESNLKDRLRNKKIILPEIETAKVNPEVFNSDFTDRLIHIPELTLEAKEELSKDENLSSLFGGEPRHYSTEEQFSALFGDHPDLAEKIAPEIVSKEINAKTGESTLKIGPRPPKEKEPLTLKSVLTDVYNDQHLSKLATLGLEKSLGKKLPFALKPEELVVKSRDSRRTANSMIGKIGEKEDSKRGVFNYLTGEKVHDTLVQTLSTIPEKEMDNFRRFAIYKHAIDLNAKGELTGVNNYEAKAFVAKYEKTLGETQKKFVSWCNAVLKYATDGGVMTQESYDKLELKYPNYSPFNRLTEEMKGKGSGYKKKVVYTREGSELPFLDPVAMAAEKAYNVSRLVDENAAKLALINADSLREGNAKLLREVGIKGKVNLDEQEFKNPELNDANFSRPMDERIPLKDNQIGYFDKGVYKVASLHDAEFAKTLKFMGYDDGFIKGLSFWLPPVKAAASLARFGISGGADFLVRHILRSEVSTSLISDKWRVPIVGTLAKLGDAIGQKSELYIKAEKAGALHGVMTDVNDDFMKSRDFVMRDKEGAFSTAVNILKTPFSVVHSMMRIAEEAKRISVFESRLKDLGPNPMWSDVLEAGWQSRKDSVDGLQRGAKMQGLNMITAFQHYEMQGLGRTVEAWQEDPKRMLIRSALMTGISAALWYSHFDDDEYNAKPNYEKNAFWHIKVGSEYVKFAKPWGPGYIFASLPERMLDLEYGHNPRALHGFGETLSSIIPISRPTVLTQWQALHDNYNSLTDRQIITDRLMKEAPESRRMPYTSGPAILIAKALSYIPGAGKVNLNSPMMVDHAINMWTGQMGRMAIQGVDKILTANGIGEEKTQPVWNEPADVPFLGGFISRHENFNAQPIKDFQEEFKLASENYSTWKAYEKAGKYAEMDEFERKHPEVIDFKEMQNANRMISEQGKLIRDINLLPVSAMSVTDRQQQIPDLWKTMVITAKTKLDEIDQKRKNVVKQ